MRRFLVPAIIYGDWRPILNILGNILIIGYFLIPHVGAQMMDAQVEVRLSTIEYRLSKIEQYQENSTIGWDKIGAICAVLGLIGTVSTMYVKGQIRISILQFANEVAKDIDDKFVHTRSYDSGMKHILDELASIKEAQRRMSQ